MDRYFNQSNLKLYGQIFDAVDFNELGIIEMEEVLKIVQQMDPTISVESVRSMIELVDDDFNGEMSKEEFVRFMFICENCSIDDVRTILYLAADEDYSNSIDNIELNHILNKLGIMVSQTEADEIMERLVDIEG